MLHESRRKKQQGIVIKIDFEKAYDKVDWNYLFKCISQRGFSEKWCKIFELIINEPFVSR
jgi:hypothetical protein